MRPEINHSQISCLARTNLAKKADSDSDSLLRKLKAHCAAFESGESEPAALKGTNMTDAYRLSRLKSTEIPKEKVKIND